MYSGSNSFLGGQSGRGPPFQPSPFQNSQQPQPQQQNPNPTGYGAAPQQPAYTGYMQPQVTGYMQPQATGYMPPQQTGFQQPQQFNAQAPPLPQIPSQFQNQAQNQAQGQGQYQNQFQPPSPATPVKPQQTGFSQMADSFKTSAAPAPRGRRPSKAKTGTKIPSIRLSFITAQDQAKFEQLFKSAVGDGQTLSGDKARDLLMRSKLDGNALSQIW
jgi:hypothetical protein